MFSTNHSQTEEVTLFNALKHIVSLIDAHNCHLLGTGVLVQGHGRKTEKYPIEIWMHAHLADTILKNGELLEGPNAVIRGQNGEICTEWLKEVSSGDHYLPSNYWVLTLIGNSCPDLLEDVHQFKINNGCKAFRLALLEEVEPLYIMQLVVDESFDLTSLKHADLHASDILAFKLEDYLTPKALAIFDMDSTLIQIEVIDELAKAAGVGNEVAQITLDAMQGKLDFQESYRKRLQLLKGLPEDAVYALCDNLPLMAGAKKLFEALKSRDIKTAIVSGGFKVLATKLQKMLGVDEVFANVLEMRLGCVTGQVVLPIVDGDFKKTVLLQMAAQMQIPISQTLAVGDGANDIPMLQAAGLGIAFHAKPRVIKATRHNISYAPLSVIDYLLPPA